MNITSGSVLARNFLINLLGQVAPLLAAIFTLPRIIEGLGTDRFGVLSLAWVVIGYFSLFDLGLGRALTQVVGATVREGHDTQAPPVVWPALGMMLGLGVLGTLVVCGVSPWLV